MKKYRCRFDQVINELGLKNTFIANKLHISNMQVTRWRQGDLPNKTNRAKLSKLLRISEPNLFYWNTLTNKDNENLLTDTQESN